MVIASGWSATMTASADQPWQMAPVRCCAAMHPSSPANSERILPLLKRALLALVVSLEVHARA